MHGLVLIIAIFGLLADSSKENPYEDIELESQCSQQSLPSSPGADSTKVPAAQAEHNTLTLLFRTILKTDSIMFLPADVEARLLQAEFGPELQAAGPEEGPPVSPQHQQRWGFISASGQPSFHPDWV